ncbi:MAG: ion transporter [Gemmatimonadota bacterium]
MSQRAPTPDRAPWREALRLVIFEADTPAGKAFDVALLVAILTSVLAVLLESVAAIRLHHGAALHVLEWGFTVIYSAEYLLRLICVGRPLRYAFSFYGIVDVLAIAPTYLSLLVTGTHSLLVIRALRLLRIFRVLKLVQFIGEAARLQAAMAASARKIVVFLGAVLTVVVIIGALMYMIEGEESGFTSIPQSIYWAIVTMTTVGYGDVAPATVLGKILASALMITGYGIIAVPTGIVSAELVSRAAPAASTRACPECAAEGHDADARHCKYCGAGLQGPAAPGS